MTNCPNCGAVIDPDRYRCPYCDTPYQHAWVPVVPMAPEQRAAYYGLPNLAQALMAHTITTNEARALLGLPVKE